MSENDIVIGASVNTDISQSVRALEALTKANMDMIKEIGDGFKNLTKVLGTVGNSTEKAFKKGAKKADAQSEAVKALTDSMKELEEEIKDLEDAETASGQTTKHILEQRKRAIEEEIKLQKRLKVERKHSGGDKAGLDARVIGAGQAVGKRLASLNAKTGAKEFGAMFGKLASKDFKGAIEDWGTAFEKSIGGLGSLSKKGGHRLLGKADVMSGRAAASKANGNALTGGLQSAAGTGMKAMGVVMKSLGPILNIASKLGPMFSMIGGSVAGLVKLFIDAQTQVKEFNSGLLQGVGTVGFLGKAGGNALGAYVNLEDTLNGIRAAAYSMDNMKWGISSEDHTAFINALTTEGIALDKFGADAALSGKTVQQFSGDMVHDAVTASRMLGTSVQEIGQYQAEMMTDLGVNASEVKGAFTDLASAASTSGIASNKFFAIIRSVSADLSLYDARIGSAAKMLGKLGKVMSARNASKFMQTLSQGFQNQDQDSRLKIALVAGADATKKIMTDDLADQSREMAKAASTALGITMESATSQMSSASGRKGLAKQLGKKGQGDLAEGVIDLSINKDMVEKGGLYGLAGGMKGASMGAAYDIQKKAVGRFSGKSSVMEGINTIGGAKMAQNLNITEDQLRGMAKLEVALDGQKQALVEQLKSGDAKAREDALKQLQAAGVQVGSADEAVKALESGSVRTNQLLGTMTKEEQAALENAQKSQQQLAIDQNTLTDSMEKKITRIMEFLMNQLYNVLINVWEAITDLPGWGKESKLDKAATLAMMRSGDTELARAAGSGGNAKGVLASGAVGTKMAAMAGTKEGKTAGAFAMGANLTGEEIRKHALRSGATGKQSLALHGALQKQRQKYGDVDTSVRGGYDVSAAMKEAGIGDELATKMIQSGMWATDSTAGLAGMAKAVQAYKSPADAKKAQEAAADPAAAKAAAAAAAATPAAPATTQQAVAQQAVAQQTPAAQAAVAGFAPESLPAEKLDDMLDQNKRVETALRRTGIKLEKGFMTSDYYQIIKGATYEAFAKALFEFALLDKLSSSELTNMAKQGGFDPTTAGANYLSSIQDKPHAAGGLVTGISGGLAQVRPAAGEGLTSIGTGERIVPAGGGGNPVVSVTVNGIGGNDLARLIEAKVADGIYEYKRREGYAG